jgi:hypothetical protein
LIDLWFVPRKLVEARWNKEIFMFWQTSMRYLGSKATGLKLGLLAAGGVAMLAAAAPAHAGIRIGFGFSIPIFTPAPVYVPQQRVYYTPPVYYSGPPVAYGPANVPVACPPMLPAYAPAPVYCPPPAYCPPPVSYQAPRPVFYHPIYRARYQPRIVMGGHWGQWRRPDRYTHQWFRGGDRNGHRNFAPRRDRH